MTDYVNTLSNSSIANVYFMGRWVQRRFQDTPIMYTTNLGAEILFQIEDSTYFELQTILPDLETPQTLSIDIDHQLQLVSLDKATIRFELNHSHSHLIRIVFTGNTDADDVWQGNQGLAIKSIRASKNGVLHPIKPNGPLVAFIGDSITAGCWVRGSHPSIDYGADINYAARLSQMFNWEDYRIAYSAAGILRYGTGGVPAAPRFINYVDFNITAPAVNPSMVFINLGTNDKKFEESLFQPFFMQFMREVQSKFSNSKLFVIVPFDQTHVESITSVSEALNISIIPTKDWNIETIDGVHPNVNGSITIAQKMSDFLVHHQIS